MSVYALVTLYNPSKDNIANICNISEQVDKIYLIDNSDITNKMLIDSLENAKNIEYNFMNKNTGLSVGFNYILNKYKFNDDDYIIFFDQDTVINNDFITSMLNFYQEIEKCVNVGCLSPVRIDSFSNEKIITQKKETIKEGFYSVQNVITSSMLVKFGNLKNIGFWNENIFLDMADWELSWRFIKNKYVNILTDKLAILHSIGTGTKKKLFFTVDKCAPIREYYIIRDGIRLMLSNVTPIKKRLTLLYILTFRSFLHLLFLDNKKLRLKYMLWGFIDYIKNKKGAFTR